jgi:hypothetical protein
MSYLISIGVSVGLLIAFIILVYVEGRTGKRLFPTLRLAFDRKVARVAFISKHIDWGGFFGHIFKLTIERVAHDVVHGVLLAVRTVERWLTRLIRVLRERLASRSSAAPTEEFQLRATLEQFRKNLRREK